MRGCGEIEREKDKERQGKKDSDTERENKEKQRENMNGPKKIFNISCSENLSYKWEGSLFKTVEAIFSQSSSARVRLLERGPGQGHLERMIAAHAPGLC